MRAVSPLAAACPRCHARVLDVRVDFDLGVLIGTPRLDPAVLDATAIVACVITSVPLWQVYDHAGRTVTSQRSAWWPRAPMPGHVLAEHACARTWPGAPIDLAPFVAATAVPDICPF